MRTPDRCYLPTRSNLYEAGAPVDANFQGTDSVPPIILLNFMYGVAAYKRWKTLPGEGMLKAYFAAHYEIIPVPRPRAPSGEIEISSDEQGTTVRATIPIHPTVSDV